MQQKLTDYYDRIDGGPDGIYPRSKVLRLEPTVREILKRLDPALADCNIDAFHNWDETCDAVDVGLGILAAREACETKLARDIPALSDRTIGLMIEAAGHYASTTDELAAMLRRCDLARYGDMSASADKTEMLASALLGARDQAEKHGSRQAQRSLLDFICLVAEKAFRNQVFAPRWRDELERDLLADGYKLIWEISCTPDDDTHVELLPTDAAPVPLAVEITALESELIACGYTSVLDHYRQAVDGYTNHKYESANGDLRTALEDLVTRLAEDHAGYAPAPGKPGERGDPTLDPDRASPRRRRRDAAARALETLPYQRAAPRPVRRRRSTVPAAGHHCYGPFPAQAPQHCVTALGNLLCSPA